MKLRVVPMLGAAAVLTGCATLPKADVERAYISVLQSVAGPTGCDFTVRNMKDEQRRQPNELGWNIMTRDFPPARGSVRSAATYSYATQEGMERPVMGETRCLVVIREQQSFEGEPHAELAFEIRSIDAETVEIQPRRAILRTSAIWRTAVPRVNVSVTFGLVDAQAGGRAAPPMDRTQASKPVAQILDQTQVDMGSIALGPAIEIKAAPMTLQWPEGTPTMRVIAVVGERLNRRPDPSRRIMNRQVVNLGVRYDDWPPAR